jgi:hypothetical protein
LGDTRLTGEELVQRPEYFRLIYGYEPSLGSVPLARQLVVDGRRVPLFTIGPASGPGVVTEAELAMVEENFVANVNNAWREWRMIEAITAWLGDSVVRPSNRPAELVERRREPAFDEATAQPVPLVMPADSSTFPVRANNELLLAAEVLNVLTRELDFAAIRTFRVRIERRSGSGYTIEFGPGLSRTQSEELAQAVANYPRLTSLIATVIGPTSRNAVAEMDFTFCPDGTLDSEESGVSLRRR